MSLWGIKDSKTFFDASVIAIASNGNVTLGTRLSTDANVGDFIIDTATNEHYRITSVAATTATVVAGVPGATLTARSAGAGLALSEKPIFTSTSESTSSSGDSGNPGNVFGVNVEEMTAGSSQVADITVTDGGSKYKEAPAVTVSGNATANDATISGGAVTAITINDNGSAYTAVPTITVAPPFITFDGADDVDPAADDITYTDHAFETGDEVVYAFTTNPIDGDTIASDDGTSVGSDTITATGHVFIDGDRIRYDNNSGGTAIGGLSDGATSHWVINAAANTFQLSATQGGAAISLTASDTGANHDFTYVFDPAQPVFVIDNGANSIQLARTSVLAIATTQINITADGSNEDQTLTLNGNSATAATATAVASLGAGGAGSGAPAHSGWVRRVEGTGRRAGRVQYETLVANGQKAATTGDAADDTLFPDS